jgi:D-beta-D-heptose 7-phosphate kinase / D-beta-D-heptose 1-phosphate adenosyltransferase
LSLRIVVVGDALLDRDLEGSAERLCPEAPVPVVDDPRATSRPGGAALAATLAALDGHEVTLVTALGDDAGAHELRALLAGANVTVAALPTTGSTPEKVRIRASGTTIARLDYGGAPAPPGRLGPEARAALRSAATVVVSDYGRGMAAHAAVREELSGVARRAPLVWDPHPKGPHPIPGVRLATPNESEAERLVPEVTEDGLDGVARRAATLRARWKAAGVAVTLGARGALLVDGGSTPLVVPATVAPGGNVCGAGDRFATAAGGLLAGGALLSEALAGAVEAASIFVAQGGATQLSPRREDAAGPGDAFERAARTRAAGGTVVATGGCFDLLHAGHVAMLRMARSLGDCLIVCLNSDASVRRLKGPGRPVVGESDRAAVLAALDSVDGVAIFDEDVPSRVLEELRPAIFAKGGDYSIDDLPEAATVAQWGGRAVILPYLRGRSTSSLIEEVSQHGQV